MKERATAIAAGVLVLASVAYGIAAAARGHSARAESPPDLSTASLGLDVWRALAFWSEAPAQTAVVDLRDAESYETFHLPGARNLPGAEAEEIRTALSSRRLLVIGASDAATARVAGELGAGPDTREARYLVGGAAAWFLALELPIHLFNEQPPPRGWLAARERVRQWAATPSPSDTELRGALELLANASYEPTALGSRKPAAAPGKKKKLSGGCG